MKCQIYKPCYIQRTNKVSKLLQESYQHNNFDFPSEILIHFPNVNTFHQRDSFYVIFRCLPFFNYLDIMLDTLSDLIVAFPELANLIDIGIELEFICFAIKERTTTKGIRFLSLAIVNDSVFDFSFSILIHFLIKEYKSLTNDAKAYGRLYVVNSATKEISESEIFNIILFVNSVLSQEIKVEEILDLLEILDILTISLMYVPEHLIFNMINIFHKILSFSKIIFQSKNSEGIYLSFSIYLNLFKNGYEFHNIFLDKFICFVKKNSENQPYFIKEILMNSEEEDNHDEKITL